MAANLLIETPEAYAGLIMIGGCFAVEDDALPAGALAGKQVLVCRGRSDDIRSEEHTSELQSLMRISYAVFCLKKKKHKQIKLPTDAHTIPHAIPIKTAH